MATRKGSSASKGSSKSGGGSTTKKSTRSSSRSSGAKSSSAKSSQSKTSQAKSSQAKSQQAKSSSSSRRGSGAKKSATSVSKLSKEQALQLYRDMLLIRRFEEKAGQMYGMGLIGGFCHLYIGQEAVVVGLTACIDENDTTVASYRCHGHMLACGMESKGVMAELTGRRGGYSKGKGGSMHMFSRDKNFFGGHGIVGAQVPIGTGIGFAHKYLEEGAVCLTYLGDGAINQGQVYESFNMAALWKLPTIYVIENNKYGMGTSVDRASASTELYKRGEPYGIPGEQVDGMDVLAVMDAGERAVKHAKAGKGPYVLEMMTYRYRGHSMSDPAKYRSRDEVNKMRTERDPIDRFREKILEAKVAGEDDLKSIDKDVKGIVSEAAEFAQNSPEPETEELFTDVYVDA